MVSDRYFKKPALIICAHRIFIVHTKIVIVLPIK